MLYQYVKAFHVIFVVTWFAGLFYIVRLFIYNREANDKPEPDRSILQQQFNIMIKRLWFGITWPSCILTLILGTWLVVMLDAFPLWLLLKLSFIGGLLLYHLSLHHIYKQQKEGLFNYSSNQLRIWNEIATLFLIIIVMLVVVKNEISIFWGVVFITLLTFIILGAIRIYRYLRR